MIDLSKLKEIVTLMGTNDLSEVSLKQGEEVITIKRGAQSGSVVNHQPVIYNGLLSGQPGTPHPTSPAFHPPTQPFAPVPLAGESGAGASAPAAVPAVTASIDSPMVGTYYGRPSPEAKPFVTPGQKVTAETVVCIIEAMKVFNEIKAEKSGVVETVLVKDGQAVEFGQRLIAVK